MGIVIMLEECIYGTITNSKIQFPQIFIKEATTKSEGKRNRKERERGIGDGFNRKQRLIQNERVFLEF
jgi:hypothetical protein